MEKSQPKKPKKAEHKPKNFKKIIIISGAAFLVVVCLAIIISNLASSNKNGRQSSKEDSVSNYENAKKKGQIYQTIALEDAGVTVFSGIIPKGWKSNLESNWNIVSSSVPGKETVTLTAPALDASITLISQVDYVENDHYQEGENYEYYTTYRKYQDASTYLDSYISKNYSGANLVKNLKIPTGTINQLQQYNDIRVATGEKDAQMLANNTVNIAVSGVGVSAAKKQYKIGENLIEGSTAVAAIKTSLRSTISSLLDSDAISWNIPYTIIYKADTKDAFEKYYDTYNFIVANSQFTTDYYAMVEYVSSEITKQYTAYYAAKSQAALDATNDFISSNYSSDSSRSTNEKVMEMWDDVIKEVDSYKTEDGNTIKTSIMNDVVAQNGNEFYVGDKAGIPLGFNQLDKGY